MVQDRLEGLICRPITVLSGHAEWAVAILIPFSSWCKIFRLSAFFDKLQEPIRPEAKRAK